MVVNTRLIIVAAVLHLHSLYCSTAYINQKVNGALTSPTIINFKIRVEDLKGVILYCVDSVRNQFAMNVIRGGNGERLVWVTFNKRYGVIPLGQLCGCEQCPSANFVFMIRLKVEGVRVICNFLNRDPFYIIQTNQQENHKEGVGVDFPIPLSMDNEVNKTFIMIGNKGPIVSVGKVLVHPLGEQMVGCLVDFSYNDKDVAFIENGSQMRASCPKECDSSLCNRGKCNDPGTCDCSSTPFNGLYCNRTLQRYTDGGYNTYKKNKWWIRNLAIKMSWKVSSAIKYCLLEVAAGGAYLTMVIEGSHLKVNAMSMSHINSSTVNFVHLSISDGYYTVKTQYAESKRPFKMKILTNINIGHSERTEYCQIFEGLYELVIESGDLLPAPRQQHKYSIAISTETILNTTSTIQFHTTMNSSVLMVLIIVCASFSSVVTISMILTLIYKLTVPGRNNIYQNTYEKEVNAIDLRPLPKIPIGENDNHNSTARDSDDPAYVYNSVDYVHI